MLFYNIIGFVISAFVMAKAGSYAVRFASKVAKADKISAFLTSFLLVGVVSSFPEGFISIVSAIKGEPSLGLGTLLGGNIADLSLILGLVGVAAGSIRMHKKEFAHEFWLVGLIMLPIILGFDGVINRLDGLVLVSSCLVFLASMLNEGHVLSKIANHSKNAFLKNFSLFLLCSAVVFASANFVVKFAEGLAAGFGMPLLLVGIFFTALTTTLPEFIFSLNAVRLKLGDLAVGNLFGTVIIDATLLVGLTAAISPISVDGMNLANVAVFSLLALASTLYFLKPGKVFTRREGILMVMLYILFVVMQMATSLPRA